MRDTVVVVLWYTLAVYIETHRQHRADRYLVNWGGDNFIRIDEYVDLYFLELIACNRQRFKRNKHAFIIAKNARGTYEKKHL